MERATDTITDIPREWTFESAAIASGFNAHVREQLPWYDMVTGAITHIARHYIPIAVEELRFEASSYAPMIRKLSVNRSVQARAFLGKMTSKKWWMASVKSLKWA